MSETFDGSACEAGVGPFAGYGAYIGAAVAVLFIPYAIVRAFRR